MQTPCLTDACKQKNMKNPKITAIFSIFFKNMQAKVKHRGLNNN